MEALHDTNLFGNGVVAVDQTVNNSTCEHCKKPFEPRAGSGGKPQRFCSTECRQEFHSQRSQRSPTCSDLNAPAGGGQPAEKLLPAATPEDDFDWYGDDVVIHEQPATAIYFNRQGALVIRQQASLYEDDDPFVFISRENIAHFIDKLTNIIGIPSAGRR